jgi:thiamine biosynthesis lipoprotein
VVNAGGDLRVHGTRAETVAVRGATDNMSALLELADGAIASSVAGTRDAGAQCPHVHGATRAVVHSGSAVAVVAPRCIHADALTKVVLAGDTQVSAAALHACAAHAVLHDDSRHARWLGFAA